MDAMKPESTAPAPDPVEVREGLWKARSAHPRALFRIGVGKKHAQANSLYLEVNGKRRFEVGNDCDTCHFWFKMLQEPKTVATKKVVNLPKSLSVPRPTDAALIKDISPVIDLMDKGDHYVFNTQLNLVGPYASTDESSYFYNTEFQDLWDIEDPAAEDLLSGWEHYEARTPRVYRHGDILEKQFDFVIPLVPASKLKQENIRLYQQMIAGGDRPRVLLLGLLQRAVRPGQLPRHPRAQGEQVLPPRRRRLERPRPPRRAAGLARRGVSRRGLPAAVAALGGAALVIGQLFPLSPLVDAVEGGAFYDASLSFPAGYVLLAPLSALADLLTFSSKTQALAWLAWLFGAYWLAAPFREPRPALRALAGFLAYALLVLLFIAWALLSPRPMARLVLPDPDLLAVDLHSHSSCSHDGRRGFGPSANARWHEAAGFHAGFLTDHNKEACARRFASVPGFQALGGVELSLHGAHVLALSPHSVVPVERYQGGQAGLEAFLREAGPRWGALAVLSLPEYWKHHWH
ncbi:MAG: hypothetical protein FD126_3631, partial [Elusimicrobia bacterium]